MHPLIAHIHPAFRTAFLAWLLSRGALWLFQGFGMAAAGEGALLSGLMQAFLDYGEQVLSAGPPLMMLMLMPALLLEVVLFFGGLSVYRFVRATELPQVAERATWLWFFSPVLAFTAGDWGLQMAAALGAMALGSLVSMRPKRSAVASALAVAARPEYLLLWPAIAWAGFKKHRPGKEPAYTPWLAALTLPVSFVVTIGLTFLLAGRTYVSFRSLYEEGSEWRTMETLIPSTVGEGILYFAVVMSGLLSLRYVARLPKWHLPVVAVAGLLALLQAPVVASGVVALAWALPTMLHLGLSTDDPARERLVLVTFVVGYLALL